MAMLRLSTIYLDGVEMLLVSSRAVEALPDALRHVPGEFRGDCKVVVRGVGGRHHGRSSAARRRVWSVAATRPISASKTRRSPNAMRGSK